MVISVDGGWLLLLWLLVLLLDCIESRSSISIYIHFFPPKRSSISIYNFFPPKSSSRLPHGMAHGVPSPISSPWFPYAYLVSHHHPIPSHPTSVRSELSRIKCRVVGAAAIGQLTIAERNSSQFLLVIVAVER